MQIYHFMAIKFSLNSDSIMLLDASYLCHFAIFGAWEKYKQHFPLPSNISKYDFAADSEFKAFFVQNIYTYINRVKGKFLIDSNIVFCCDCKRSNIWRKKIFPEYKIQRDIKKADTEPNFGSCFGLFLREMLPVMCEKNGYKIVRHNESEGDDLLAIGKNYYRNKFPEKNIIIIANDKDFLQLYDSKTIIQDLQGNDLNRNSLGSPQKDLMTKLLIGDKGDGIPSVKERTGIKTVLKMFENTELLREFLADPEVYKKYELNKKLIDFREIPKNIVEEVTKLYDEMNLE